MNRWMISVITLLFLVFLPLFALAEETPLPRDGNVTVQWSQLSNLKIGKEDKSENFYLRVLVCNISEKSRGKEVTEYNIKQITFVPDCLPVTKKIGPVPLKKGQTVAISQDLSETRISTNAINKAAKILSMIQFKKNPKFALKIELMQNRKPLLNKSLQYGWIPLPTVKAQSDLRDLAFFFNPKLDIFPFRTDIKVKFENKVLARPNEKVLSATNLQDKDLTGIPPGGASGATNPLVPPSKPAEARRDVQ